MGYSQKNSKGQDYHLHTQEVTLRGNRKQTIYYFRKQPDSAKACDLPAGFEVFENARNGFLMVRRKK